MSHSCDPCVVSSLINMFVLKRKMLLTVLYTYSRSIFSETLAEIRKEVQYLIYLLDGHGGLIVVCVFLTRDTVSASDTY
uniref:Uncharacterized protein n=1 Tax=Arundo donax TaxID=35708 RepID=A0A0A8ZHH9_ARUDO